MCPWCGSGLGWTIWMMVAMAVFWLLLIAGIILLIVWFTGRSRHMTESALDILDRRYARGEISRDEYEAMKRDILSRGG